jgi:hypothetical protein
VLISARDVNYTWILPEIALSLVLWMEWTVEFDIQKTNAQREDTICMKATQNISLIAFRIVTTCSRCDKGLFWLHIITEVVLYNYQPITNRGAAEAEPGSTF